METKEPVQTAGEYNPDIIDSVEEVSYEKALVKECIEQTQGRYIVNFAEDLVTVGMDGSEMDNGHGRAGL